MWSSWTPPCSLRSCTGLLCMEWSLERAPCGLGRFVFGSLFVCFYTVARTGMALNFYRCMQNISWVASPDLRMAFQQLSLLPVVAAWRQFMKNPFRKRSIAQEFGKMAFHQLTTKEDITVLPSSNEFESSKRHRQLSSVSRMLASGRRNRPSCVVRAVVSYRDVLLLVPCHVLLVTDTKKWQLSWLAHILERNASNDPYNSTQVTTDFNRCHVCLADV